jgi:hypothetical protein
MHVVYPRCCGLDIHQKTIVACVLLTDAAVRLAEQHAGDLALVWWTPVQLGVKPPRRCSHGEAHASLSAGISR